MPASGTRWRWRSAPPSCCWPMARAPAMSLAVSRRSSSRWPAVALASSLRGGGESPSLPGLVAAEDIELAGCAVGAVPEGRRPLLGEALEPGDEIVLVASSGLHANGASLARRVAAELPHGYATPLASGRNFGEALLDRSLIYAALVRGLLEADVAVHYLSHITGHGLLKLMRPRRELGYEITALP